MTITCGMPGLMVRTEQLPRSGAFARGADAFDRATLDWNKRRFLDAAKGFMTASAEFAAAGVEGNFKWSLENAALAYGAAGKLDEGKAAFEAAAVKDPPHAAALRARGAAIVSYAGCK